MRQSSRSSSKPKELSRFQFIFEAIGTHWQIDLLADSADAPSIEQAVRRRIDEFDRTYSRFRADSWVTELSKTPGEVQLPADAQPLFDIYRSMYEITDGAVTPLIGQVLSDAGYDASYSLQPKQLHQPPAWDTALQYDAPRNQLEVLQPVLLDFGAAGKGYLVDIVCDSLEAHGVEVYCVDAGGDMRQRLPSTQQAERVGMEHPDHPGQVVGIVQLGNQSLCGSAGNRRQWAGMHHIMNPRSLDSVRIVKAVWTVAQTALAADAMATCLFFAEGALLQRHFDFSYTIIYSDNSYFVSAAFPGQVFSDSSVG